LKIQKKEAYRAALLEQMQQKERRKDEEKKKRELEEKEDEERRQKEIIQIQQQQQLEDQKAKERQIVEDALLARQIEDAARAKIESNDLKKKNKRPNNLYDPSTYTASQEIPIQQKPQIQPLSFQHYQNHGTPTQFSHENFQQESINVGQKAVEDQMVKIKLQLVAELEGVKREADIALRDRMEAQQELERLQLEFKEMQEDENNYMDNLKKALLNTQTGPPARGNQLTVENQKQDPINIYGMKGDASYYNDLAKSIALDCKTKFLPMDNQLLSSQLDSSVFDKIARNSYNRVIAQNQNKYRRETNNKDEVIDNIDMMMQKYYQNR